MLELRALRHPREHQHSSPQTHTQRLIKEHPGGRVCRAMEAGENIEKLGPFIISGAKASEGVGSLRHRNWSILGGILFRPSKCGLSVKVSVGVQRSKGQHETIILSPNPFRSKTKCSVYVPEIRDTEQSILISNHSMGEL